MMKDREGYRKQVLDAVPEIGRRSYSAAVV